MFPHQRQNKIIELLNKNKSITVNELAIDFNVTKATIRADLNFLEKTGKLIRTHGGAILKDEAILDVESSSYNLRKSKNLEEKMIIAKEAINFINDNQCIVLDASSTCYELAKLINYSDLKNLTIITNGLRTASLLKENPSINVVIIGGSLRKDSNAVDSLLGVELLSKFIIESSFVSSFSVDCKNGLSDFNLDEIELKKEMIQNSEKTYALIDSNKFGLRSLAVFSSLKNIDVIITNKDDNKNDEFDKIKNHTELIIV